MPRLSAICLLYTSIYISRRCDINFVILSLVYIVLFGLKNKLLVELFAGTKPRKLYVLSLIHISLSVLELSELVKAVEEEFGVSAAAAVAVAAPAAGGARCV